MAFQLKKEDEDEIKKIFQMLENDQHKITARELGTVLRSFGLNPTEAELQEMINEVDQESESLDYPEFLNLFTRKIQDSEVVAEEELLDAFKQIDTSGKNLISVQELKQILGEKISDEEVEEIIKEADLDQDGNISQEEFIKMMKAK